MQAQNQTDNTPTLANEDLQGAAVFMFGAGQSNWKDPYGGKTGVRGKGNQHDHARGVDIRINDEYIRNGNDNYRPYDIINAVKRSTIQKRAFQSISALAAGKLVFLDRDGGMVSDQRQRELTEIYHNLGITHNGFIAPVTRSNYLFGGCPVTIQWASTGREFAVQQVVKRDYKTFRLSKPMWNKSTYKHEKHFYHKDWGYKEERRNRRVIVDKRTLSWVQWNQDIQRNWDQVCYFPAYDPRLSLSQRVNRVQSYFVAQTDELSDFYPLSVWFSGSSMNYIRAEFSLSCFDIDDIENGFHASGMVKVYHRAFKDPTTGEARQVWEKKKKQIEDRVMKSYNSGAIFVVPVGLDGKGKSMPINDTIEFVPFQTNNNKDRHTILNDRIKQTILSANGAICSELFGVENATSTFSEGNEKLAVAMRLLNKFTIKPLKQLLDDPQSGFFNVLNRILGIEETTAILPNMAEFLNIAPDLSKHFLHPEQWYDMFRDFGFSRPTAEQIASGLIPAYRQQNMMS